MNGGCSRSSNPPPSAPSPPLPGEIECGANFTRDTATDSTSPSCCGREGRGGEGSFHSFSRFAAVRSVYTDERPSSPPFFLPCRALIAESERLLVVFLPFPLLFHSFSSSSSLSLAIPSTSTTTPPATLGSPSLCFPLVPRAACSSSYSFSLIGTAFINIQWTGNVPRGRETSGRFRSRAEEAILRL